MELRVVSGKTNGTGKPSGATPEPRLLGPKRDGYTRGERIQMRAKLHKPGPGGHFVPLGWPRLNSNWPKFGEPDYVEIDTGGTPKVGGLDLRGSVIGLLIFAPLGLIACRPDDSTVRPPVHTSITTTADMVESTTDEISTTRSPQETSARRRRTLDIPEPIVPGTTSVTRLTGCALQATCATTKTSVPKPPTGDSSKSQQE
jgi:hypothetical protein